LNLKANLANPTFTGTLVAPTINATARYRRMALILIANSPIVNPIFSGAVVSNSVALRFRVSLYRNWDSEQLQARISISCNRYLSNNGANPHSYGVLWYD
jgi:hypothetical protein